MSSNQARERATNVAPVERWLSRPAGGDKTEDRLASLIRTSGPPAGLGAVARARVWSRLRQRPTSRARIARLRWSVALSLLLTSGVVLGALSARRWWPAKPARNMPGLTPATPHAARGVRALGQQPPLQPPVDEPVPEAAPPAPPVRASAAPHASQARGGIVAEAEPAARTTGRGPEAISPSRSESPGLDPAAPSPGASALSGETSLLGEALLQLRQKRDARAALAALDEYRARYPNGTLTREAETARIDALLLLGRNDEALAELGALTLQAVGRDQELRLIRGELAAAADCKRAFVDFDRILNEQATASVVERALHGRAACRLRTGDETGATRDLTEYLRRFPAGRFAPEARRTLEARREEL
jgi:TolA-binding protein